MSEPQIAALLLHFRDAARSARCIQSLLDEGVEHVLVWDNSADAGASADVLREMLARDSRVRLESTGENLGFAAGVNRGLAACKKYFQADVAIVINDDATLLPGALSVLCTAARQHPKAFVLSMDVLHAGRRQGPLYYQRWSGLQFTQLVRGAFPYASGCCLWIDLRSASLPLLDEAFFMYGEDCELGWRLSQQPDSWIHLPQALVAHEGSASSGLGSSFYETHMVAAHLLLAQKLARQPTQAAWFLVARIPILLARALVRSVRFRSMRPWYALWRGAVLAHKRHG